ncbi:MAG: class I tRNA ligase family protein [Thermoanaerobaculia bacterium]
MSSHKLDDRRRDLARRVRRWAVEDFHDQLAEAGVTRAYVISENGELTLSHPEILAPVKAFFELSQDFDHHEGVFIGREEGLPTLFFAGVHDTRRGLAQGGLRFKPYGSLAEVLVDVLRLAQGMTRKSALAGLWWGGGKGIVPITRGLDDPAYQTEETPERRELFRAYGRFVASLGGVYYTAEDIGTKTSDMNSLLSQNRFTTCIGADHGGSGNPSPITARGVFLAMRAAWRFLTGSDDLHGVRVAVQGVGNVGGPLVELLDGVGARVWATDIDRRALERLKAERPRTEIVELDEIFDLDADVFAPCAIGAQVNVHTIPRLRVRLVCGAANNILGEEADAERLRKRGIAYVPDYLCNRMGITNCADEWQGYLASDVELAAERVYPDTSRVLRHARSQLITSAAAADQLADIAASELHPMLGHRGRRIIDQLIVGDWAKRRRQRPGAGVRPGFVAGSDEPVVRVRWERQGRFRGRGPAVAAAPISAAGRPDLSSFLSALLMDVRARAIELLGGERPRRVVGADPGGLALQLAVERSLPFEREEIGRPRFVELCLDRYRQNDEAVRDQLHQLGAGFDPGAWLDAMSAEGREVARRLYRHLDGAGLLKRERRLTYFDPVEQTVLVSPDVVRDTLEVDERFSIRFEIAGGGVVETQTFFPELLLGTVALAVRADGPYGGLAGNTAAHPFDGGTELPILAFTDLATDAKFLVPAHDRDDHELLEDLAATADVSLAPERTAIDGKGLFLVPGEPPLEREQARRLVVERLGDRVTRHEGRFEVDTFRSRRSHTLVHLGTSEQLFLHLESAAEPLRRAIESGEIEFSDERWRRRALEFAAGPEPWCISRQNWWGHPIPSPGEGDSDEVLSVWFSLAAWSLLAVGWPRQKVPEPVAEVFVDSDLFGRWLMPSQLLSMAVAGRPAFRRVEVHGVLNVVERVLEPRSGVATDAADEDRFVARHVRRPMRRRAGNVVEPRTLIRRFGADALRLGYLLSLHGGTKVKATASESNLRRARRAVHRLNSKVSGLLHLTRDADSGGHLALADEWIVARCARATAEARQAYREHRLAAVAHLLTAVIDDFARYAAVAAGRLHRGADLGSIRATVAAVISRLADGFSPVCPYIFDKLVSWTREQAVHFGSDATVPEPPDWLVDLVAELDRRRGHRVEISVADPAAARLIEGGRLELAALARTEIAIVAEAGSDARIVGPCAVAPSPGRA